MSAYLRGDPYVTQRQAFMTYVHKATNEYEEWLIASEARV